MGLAPKISGITSEEQVKKAKQLQELMAQRNAVQQAGEQPQAAKTGAVDGGFNVQPTFGEYTIPGVQGTEGIEGVRRSPLHRVQDVDGSMVGYTNQYGAVGLTDVAVSPFAGAGQAGRQEDPDYVHKFKNLYA